MSGELNVEGLPPAIKAKITQLMKASHDAAFVGASAPEDREEIEQSEKWARYALERTILTHLQKTAATAA